LAHVGIKATHQVDVAEHLQVPSGAPGWIVNFLKPTRRDCASIVDKDVSVTEGGRDAIRLPWPRNIRRKGHGPAASLLLDGLRDRLKLLKRARHQRHIASLAREAAGDGSADPLRRTRHQRQLPIERKIHRGFSSFLTTTD